MTDRRQLLVKAYKLFDIFIMAACFAVASWVSYLNQNGLYSFNQFLSIRIKIQNFVLFIAMTLFWHRRRFSVRLGITCLWQVDRRYDIPFEKWMELDMEYIDKCPYGLTLRF